MKQIDYPKPYPSDEQTGKLENLVKDKNLQSKYKITLDNVREAYPTIRWGGRGG